ncbi:hypothetical protein IV38_GL000691 [Lactobacillus selangorensis]|uniref:Exosortase family protein XrtG n=1 Tax=Lactobacillus selangorensis TaxID=81857 RepID=A0A0R2FLQ3_9LACO|nr:exosortase family protein XrtG [Lactobacillus selangorensis]KRN27285.1 hypothetical protein IV38_GL000691 [Lactobacillus selangorensis]KRN29932.1 hypothetical protein IV40_GL000530 [Lactobacillus selangorensis]
MNPLLLIGIIAWLYLISILKRSNLSAYYFIIGSVGLFFILIALSNRYWVWFFTHAVINSVSIYGALTHMCRLYVKYGLVYIVNNGAPVTMSIDYECSGIIETCAFVALVCFFPVYNRQQRVLIAPRGILWIYLSNVIRLITVILIVHFAGGSQFYLAHSIIGRILFYALVIVLYYRTFTYSQITRSTQKA